MKSAIILVLSAAVAMASPAAVSLNRATREANVNGVVAQLACVECPCTPDLRNPVCTCVPNGCCCT
ncbi:hypothetical protein CC78DRAFT_536641 [Lojkania enalia]|uniref:Uncharacterized protein n=1 Tax=Lojkania enalia TaxID=147567 RepID=A0A9P4N011_9PLEO|nr:hypothetical protein CC78DRAFT_536641 [Didymosphaeria enalia]